MTNEILLARESVKNITEDKLPLQMFEKYSEVGSILGRMILCMNTKEY